MNNNKIQETIPKFEPVVQDKTLLHAIIVDIDGTVAHMNWRSPYDYSKVSTDTLDEVVHGIVSTLESNYEIIFVSGRKAECMDETVEWLSNHFTFPISLHMRANGDNRCDTIVKREILEELIKEYYIVASLDDRNRVVNMWRESGIKCLQVQEGNF